MDDFTVTARNSGFGINLLNLFAPTDTTTTVAVDLKPVIGAPTESTQGFNVWNYSSKPIQYLSMTPLSDDTSLSDLMGPAFNTIIQPGENAHFELVVYYLYDARAWPPFHRSSTTEALWAGA